MFSKIFNILLVWCSTLAAGMCMLCRLCRLFCRLAAAAWAWPCSTGSTYNQQQIDTQIKFETLKYFCKYFLQIFLYEVSIINICILYLLLFLGRGWSIDREGTIHWHAGPMSESPNVIILIITDIFDNVLVRSGKCDLQSNTGCGLLARLQPLSLQMMISTNKTPIKIIHGLSLYCVCHSVTGIHSPLSTAIIKSPCLLFQDWHRNDPR